MNKFEILQKLHVTQDQKNRVETAVIDCLLTAQKHFGVDKVKVIPEIRYNTKGKAAGLCYYDYLTGKHWIDINPILLNENEIDIIKQTVPHEMAHCVVNQLYPNERLAHGYEWQSVMRLFGLSPERCHNMNTSTITIIKNGGMEYHYNCGCMVHKLTKIKHNRMQRGVGYRCNRCKQPLKFDKTVHV